MNPSTANAVALETAFARPLDYLAYSIQGMVIAGVLGAAAPEAVALGAVVWGLQNVLRLANFAGRLGVVEESAEAVAHGETAPWSVEPEPVSMPITIAIPKGPKILPPYAPPSMGKVPFFEEAAADIISRQPVVIQDPLLRTAEEVGNLYREEHVFALAKSTSMTVTKKVQDIIEEGITQGLPVPRAVDKIIEASSDWTRAYAETVYRTNLATAQTDGRFQQASRPGMELILPVMVFHASPDGPVPRGRVRPNHWACHLAAAAPGDSMWDKIRPPLGYNCRCRVELVSWEMARRMGLVSERGEVRKRAPRPGGGPDRGFVHSGRSRWA